MIVSIRRTLFPIFIILMLISMVSCSKEPGTGGNSTIYGKVFVKDYNSTFTILEEEYYGQDVDVFLIYGDNRSYSDHVRTSFDGSYEFKYLRPGDYHVYCYSEDSTLQSHALLPILRDVTIDKKHQEIEVPTMVIFK
jgi:hypothetical protein